MCDEVSQGYKDAYTNLMAAKDRYRTAQTNLPECKDFLDADAMRDARLSVYIAAREALPEYSEVIKLCNALSVEYNKGIWEKPRETS